MGAPIIGLYAAPILLLVIALGLRVVFLRRRFRVGIGDGGHPELARAIRAQANTLEVPPLVLLLAALAELGGAQAMFLHGIGSMLLVGRLIHAHGLSRRSGRSFGRFNGTLLTWLAGLIAASLLVMQWFTR